MTSYRLTVSRHALADNAPVTVAERAVRERLTPLAGRALVREIVSGVRQGATVDARTRDRADHAWRDVLRGQTERLLATPYDAWPAHVTYRIRHTVHLTDGLHAVETRVTLEPGPDTTGW